MPVSPFKMLAVSALVAAAFGAAAKPLPAWSPTHTLAHETGTALHGPALRAGELVQVTVALALRNEAQLDALTSSILAGKTQRHLSSDEFMARHAPSAEQVKAVVDHLSRNGFVHIEVAPNRLLVTADGSAASVKQAFQAELHHFSVDGRDAYANVTDARVPAALSGIVSAVLGLQTVDMARPMLKEASGAADAENDAAPEAGTAAVTGHSPTEFSAIYNASGLAPATQSTVGIIAAGNISQSLVDLGTFVSQAGYASPTVKTVVVGTAGTDTSGVPEWDLDSQDALAAAGGAVKGITFYVATSLSDAALTAAYNKAVSDNTATVVNVSLGECEKTAQRSGVAAADDAIFKAAVAQGQTFSVSSGDSGSTQCTGRKNSQSYPAVSPYVIALGGTTLTTAAVGVWAGETAWNGTGGGPSIIETAPAWQVSSGVLKGSTQRGVPDIAFDADPSSGAKIIVRGKTAQYGGTSLSAPLFAGFWARIQSAHNNALVFPASALYQYGPGNPSLFHDVVSGSNGGFSAAPGWDYTTGFGSLNVGNFAAFINTHPGF